MWPFIRLNPVGIIVVTLLFFSLYLIYTANSISNNYMRNYEEQVFVSNFHKKLPENEDELLPAITNQRHSLLNDEIIKQEFRLFEMVNLIELLNVAIQAAENGGRQVRKVREFSNLKQQDKGSENGLKNPLTEGDIRSHQVMVGQLSIAFPGIKIISEEANSHMKDVEQVELKRLNRLQLIDQLKNLNINRHVPLSELTVWVDPLDATQEYTENLVKYVTTMVCVAYKGQPLIGVIHKPFPNPKYKVNANDNRLSGETYWAWDKVAMSPNIKDAIDRRKKNVDNEESVRVIVSRSHNGTVSQLSDSLFGKKSKIISAGGSGYKTIELIKGNSDVYLHNSLIFKYDICAPNALLNAISRNINATFSTLKGESIVYNDENIRNREGVLATIGLNHDKIVQNFKKIL